MVKFGIRESSQAVSGFGEYNTWPVFPLPHPVRISVYARFSRLTVILSRLRFRTWLGTQEDRYPDFRTPRRRLWGCDVDGLWKPSRRRNWTDSRTETLSPHTPKSIHGAQTRTERSHLCSFRNFLNTADANAWRPEGHSDATMFYELPAP